MLSICIPIYNFDVTELVKSIQKQIVNLQENIEIILIDDCSTIYQTINRELKNTCIYVELPKNIGRSKIRNLFLDYAQFPYLLFLDCDSTVISSDFIATYLIELKKGVSVACGGRIYPEISPSLQQKLSWKYGRESESKSATIRNISPNSSFMTNNFLIQKDLMNLIEFEERLTNYGHEDTLYGYELRKHHIKIIHLENPILNGDLETNKVFLKKTELAIQNLDLILQFIENDVSFYNEVSLLRVYMKLKIFRSFILIFSKVYNPIIRFFLLRGIVNIHLFNLYKLCYLFSIKKAVKNF